ncbi:hypothetical protein A7985_12320 [Pseudoalteromonas luteoviolacea]|uniref:Dockerin domain-containing protein n=1 Tax=Pseudoalteromonas luteoviolacea TaxID=43657 RepID=A0A1C0TRC2_9GAMM|nr:dockerin type I domain-containing protein [Pseudoalteromonas luteoviolacea]OCQ21395.1 hypothetical protein A7985_12320 [Pseudoalteromonas luteoviolacea]
MCIKIKKFLSSINLPNKINRNIVAAGAIAASLSVNAEILNAVGEEFQVNTYSQLSQNESNMAQLNNGDFVVTWTSHEEVTFGTGIFAKLYSAAGTPIGQEFLVNTFTTGYQRYSSVAALHDGGFVVVWVNLMSDPANPQGIYAQRFHADGTKNGEEIQIDAGSDYRQEYPNVSTVDTGGYVITWYSEQNIPDDEQRIILTQRFNADGGAATEKIRVNTSADEVLNKPQVTVQRDGSILVTWQYSKLGEYRSNIAIKKFNANGTPIGQEELVNTINTRQTRRADSQIASFDNGSFVVTWVDNIGSGKPSAIHGQIFGPNGVPIGTHFTVEHAEHIEQRQPRVRIISSEVFLIAWHEAATDSQTGSDIFVQAFYKNGLSVGPKLKANISAPNDQVEPAIIGLSDKRFMVSWTSKEQDGSLDGIFAQRFGINLPPIFSLTASTPLTPIYEGNQISLPLTVKGQSVYGIDATISLDAPSVASFTGGSYGEFLPSHERLAIPIDYIDDQWQSAVSIKAPHSAKSGEGKYATAELIAHLPGTLNLTVNAQFTDQNGAYIYQSQENYTLTVLESVFLSGNVADLAINGDYTQITLFINGSPVHIQSDGTFKYQSALGSVTLSISAPGFLTGEKKLTLSPNQADIDFGAIELVAGDQNGDNSIDIADLTQLMSAYRSTSLDPEYHPAADLNRDNKINLQDLTLLGKNFGKQGPQSF